MRRKNKMGWQDRYRPSDKQPWQGRTDIPANSCVFQIIQSLDIRDPLPTLEENVLSFAFIGFCCDEGVKRNHGRPGASEGPALLRRSIAKLPLQRDVKLYDAGDITCSDGDLEAAQKAL